MKHLVPSLIFYLLSGSCLAQGEGNNWYFGKYAALNFNNGSPQVLYNSQMLATEGCASISNRNGDLLFYSDGYFIWNRTHQRMLYNNNIAFIGDNADGTQTGVIIPRPGHDSLYYVFSIGQLGGNLYYSVVNMNRNGGLGEVVVSKVLLLANVCEKLTAIRHCNKQDFWAVTRKFNSDAYYSFQVTSAGISTTPVISNTGNFIMNTNGQEFEKAMGYLKNSPDGRLLAAAHYVSDYVELSDFNTTTGAISNPRKLYCIPAGISTPNAYGAYGIEFSPDSRLLYVSSFYGPPVNDTTTLHQFDVTLNTEAAIQTSRQFIHGDDFSFNTLTALQLGPDKKIYVAKTGSYLSVINRPEIPGTGCQFVSNQLYIDDGTGNHVCIFGLPNFIQSYFYDPVIATGNCQFSNISFSLQNLVGISNVHWNFDDPASGSNNTSNSFSPTHIFSQEGSYEVMAILFNSNGCGVDTVRKLVYAGPFDVSLGNDVTICEGDTLRLRMNIPNSGNLWSTGSNDTIISVTQAGTYWIRTTLGECSASDTITVFVRPLPVFSLGNDITICSNQSALLSPGSVPPNVSFLWNTGETTSVINTTTNGVYWLKVIEPNNNCTYTDSITVQFKALPVFNLGPDQSICDRDTILLNAMVSGSAGYLWSTGVTLPAIKAYQTGLYWAEVTKDGCVYRDSISLMVKPLPQVFLGRDTILCESEVLILNAQNAGALFQWQDASFNQTYTVTDKGIYSVMVTNDGCTASDTVMVDYLLKPIYSLGPDQSICSGQELVLSPGLNNVDYLWQDGTISPSFLVTSAGLYHVEISNRCGSNKDSIWVSEGICELYIPSGFSPNRDGKNDIFRVLGTPSLKEFSLSVFSRWGEKIFQSNDLSKGWDGKVRGTDAPVGIYVWVVRYKKMGDSEQKSLKGTIALIR